MIMRGEYEGWTRGFYGQEGGTVETYRTRRWGRDFYVEAVLLDGLSEGRAEAFLRRQLAKMMVSSGA